MKSSQYDLFSTSCGWVAALASEQGLRRLTLPKPTRKEAMKELGVLPPGAEKASHLLEGLKWGLRRYLAGEATEISSPLDTEVGTHFQRAAWRMALSIPYGETRSYSWIVQQLGKLGAASVVGQAMALNPVPMSVP